MGQFNRPQSQTDISAEIGKQQHAVNTDQHASNIVNDVSKPSDKLDAYSILTINTQFNCNTIGELTL